MKSADLRLKNVAELNDELSALLKAYFNLRIQKATQQLQNASLFKKYRRDIARVRTVLSEKGGSK